MSGLIPLAQPGIHALGWMLLHFIWQGFFASNKKYPDVSMDMLLKVISATVTNQVARCVRRNIQTNPAFTLVNLEVYPDTRIELIGRKSKLCRINNFFPLVDSGFQLR